VSTPVEYERAAARVAALCDALRVLTHELEPTASAGRCLRCWLPATADVHATPRAVLAVTIPTPRKANQPC
jgi:hypothetical protein